MSAIYGFSAMCLIALTLGFVSEAASAGFTPSARQVALNPQPLPPIEERDAWGFDEG